MILLGKKGDISSSSDEIIDPSGNFLLANLGSNSWSRSILNSCKVGVKLAKKYYTTEASGNINLKSIKKIAATGVDRISIGSITHSVSAIDLKLEI